jgi:hypothetical protein
MNKFEDGFRSLAVFLLKIGELEANAEVLRQILCEQSGFEPYTAFMLLQEDERRVITAGEIYAFLASHDCLHHSREEIMQTVLKAHDFDGDDGLSYAE